MFMGHNGFASSPFIHSCHFNKKVESLIINNMIVEEVKIDETLDSTNSIEKEEWGIDTILQAMFENNLEGGNISANGIPVEFLRFKRRKLGELKWQNMVDMNFDKDIENYDLEDFYVENGKTYEYILVPMVQSLEGVGSSSSIKTNYFSLYLTGVDSNGVLQNYPLRFDLELSDIALNEDKTFTKTLSSQYPVLRRGKAKYLTGSITADLISPTTESNLGEIDMGAENEYREVFEDFIHTNKPMLLRYHSFYALGILSDITKNPFSNETAYGIFRYNMKLTEVNNAKDLDVLKENNLTYTVKTS